VSGCSEARSDDEAFGKRVRAYLLENPEVLEEAIVRSTRSGPPPAPPVKRRPLAENRKALERDPRDPCSAIRTAR
jgi:hypothetical protein